MGITVILVLVAALVGPFFIDWTVYRSTFESYAERVLGHDVTVLGEADLRLLPAPSISFSDVRVGPAEDPLLVVSQFRMRIELPPLLKGEIRVLDMELDRPHLTLSLDEDGRLDWLTAMTPGGALARIDPEDVAFERIEIRDGALSIIDARTGDIHRIDEGNLSVSARSLEGPYKAAGRLTLNDAPYNISLATGRAQEGSGLRVKGEVTPTDLPVNFAFDGMLNQSDAAPEFQGEFNIASIALEDNDQTAWTAQGGFSAGIAEVAVPDFEFRYGPDDRRFSLTGSADLVYAGEKRFEIRAKSKQIDLDRLLGGGPQDPVDVNKAGDRLIAALRAVPLPPVEGAVSLDVPALVAGGGIIQNVRLDLETILGGWRIARLAGRLPGRTTVATQGDLSLDPALTYRGAVSVSSEQPGALMSWWQRKDTGVSAIDPVALEGRLNVVPDGAALDNLRLTLAGAQARGGLSYRKPRSGNAEFTLSLDADRLDLDQIEGLAALVRPESGPDTAGDPKGVDVSVRIRAKTVSARGVDGEGLALEADYSDGGVRIDRLFAQDLAGARLDVSGEIKSLFSAPQGVVTGTLDARDLSGVVALAAGLFPETAFLDRLERAAGSLVPARFDAELRAAALGEGTDMTLTLAGNAGGADAAVNAELEGRVDRWQAAAVDLGLSLEGPDGAKLLQQLGFDVLPVDAGGGGSLSFHAAGVPADGLAVTLAAEVGGSKLAGEGELVLKKDTDPDYRFEFTGSTGDLGPLALMAGRVLPVMTGSIPAEIAVAVEGTGSEIAITSAEGTIDGTRFEGHLEGDLEPAPGERNRRFSGALTVSQADLRNLTELILGPDQWYSAGDGSSIWPVATFGAPLLGGLDLSLAFEAGRLMVDETTEIANPRADLRLTPVMLRLDGLSGAFAGGGLEGSLSLRRTEAEAALSGRVKLDKADLRQVIWRPDNRAVASGSLDLFLEFEGAGRSISAIVAGLNGGGTFKMEEGDFRGLNPQAFPLVTRAVDAGLDLRDEKIREVFVSHMAAGSLPFKRVDGTLTLVGGRLSARNVVVDSEKAEIFGSAEVDLSKLGLDADFSLKVDPGEDAVTGAEPQVGLLFEGPVDGPERRVDIAPFTAYLTLRAFEQEVERVEKLQAEILERDRLLRELKFQREAQARRQRLAAEAAQRAEEERLRLELEETAPQEAEPEDLENSALPSPDASAPDVPGSGSADPLRQGVVTPSGAPAPFAERIRAVLEPSGLGNVSPPPGGAPAAKPAGSLPPLEPPVSIDDLITQETEGPLVLPGVQ
ncbi:AsmA family protein [Roseibium aggregatum]|uniref:AsmA family protein n=1 Tax=Roseibium aggregatum TaxID=187304 RepID=A0A939EHH5_9HYPH|nr:AsmA-like C-terminal region-containing protein [Roseibium aggregatum]MBN9671619.1 AsmA family protein [Roseibium aggregatum]